MQNYFKTKSTNLLIGFIFLFMLFQAYKFFRARITNIDLPRGKIVFSSNIDGDDEIYVMNIDGTGLKQLTNNSGTTINTATDNEASFSSDGEKIVFVSCRQGDEVRKLIYNTRGKPIGESFSGGTFDIYIMDSEGKYQSPLTYNTLSSHPFFSPDNEKVVFNALLVDKHNQNLLKMIDISSREERTLNHGGGKIAFSSDSKKIYDNFDNDISTSNIDGTGRIRLTHFSDSINQKFKVGLKFIFSSDEKKIACITIETRKMYNLKDLDDFYDINEFYTLNIDGSGLEKIYRIDGSNLGELYGEKEPKTPSRSVIREYQRLANGSLIARVYRMSELKGKSITIWDFKYSPDRKYIIFQSNSGHQYGIFALNLETDVATSLTVGKENWAEIMRFTFTPDGKRIVFIADIYPPNRVLSVILQNIKARINYYLFRKQTPYYDNKYICIMNMDGENYRRVAKLPIGSQLGHDFIHWE